MKSADRTFKVLIITLLLVLSALPAQGQIEEVYMGVDGNALVAGSRFGLNERSSALLEYIEGSSLGAGLFYAHDSWRIGLENRLPYRQLYFSSQGLFSLRLREDRITGDMSGRGSISYGDLRVMKSYFYDYEEKTRKGSLDIRKNWDAGSTRVQYDYDQEDDYLHELIVDHSGSLGDHDFLFKTHTVQDEDGLQKYNYGLNYTHYGPNDRITADLMMNEHGDKLVGLGADFRWEPEIDWLKLSLGYYKEDAVSHVRGSVTLADELTYGFDWGLLGLEGTIENIYYSSGHSRQEYTLKSRAQRIWENGSIESGVQYTERWGDSPFVFDAVDREKDLWASTVVEQKIGDLVTRFQGSYDLREKEWGKMQGRLDYSFFDLVDTRITADYNIDDPPKPDQTTFILSAEYSDSIDLSSRLTMNSNFEPLVLRLGLGFSLDDNDFILRAGYNNKENELDRLEVLIDFDQLGEVGVRYDPSQPYFMASFRPLQF